MCISGVCVFGYVCTLCIISDIMYLSFYVCKSINEAMVKTKIHFATTWFKVSSHVTLSKCLYSSFRCWAKQLNFIDTNVQSHYVMRKNTCTCACMHTHTVCFKCPPLCTHIGKAKCIEAYFLLSNFTLQLFPVIKPHRFLCKVIFSPWLDMFSQKNGNKGHHFNDSDSHLQL